MDFTEETLDSQILYQGAILTLKKDRITLPSGKETFREFTHHPGAVCVLPVDEEGNVLFVQQYRYPYGEELLELPAGKIDPGEEPLACGMRELEEETGHTAEALYELGIYYPSPGCMDEVIYLYYADKLTATRQNLDEDEFLSVQRIPLEIALQMVLEGKIVDGKTQTLLLKYCLKDKAQ